MKTKTSVYRAASAFFEAAHGREFTNAEGTQHAHAAIVAAFHLYDLEWSQRRGAFGYPRFRIEDWRWPFDELEHGGDFTGGGANNPWSILLRFAVERLRALKSPDRPVDMAGFEQPGKESAR